MSWSAGYVTDVAYLPGYYVQQTPAHLAVACMLGNVSSDIPAIHERLSYLELGCGRGLGALVLAASNPGWSVTGIDFNPAHIAEARLNAVAAGLTNITFHEADLATLADEPLTAVIPNADVISLHGVWSWVSPAVQDGIVRLLAAKLRAGGVLHISYNALPGWQGGLGLHRLLYEAGSRMAARSDRQVRAGIDLAKALHAAEARHLSRTPFSNDLVAHLDKMPTDYLAHEHMNEFWCPVFHADVVEALRPAKLDWVASADLLENFPALMLNEEQQAVQNRFDDPVMRELVKDMCHPRSLRHDVFVRGAQRITAGERDAALREIVLTLNVQPDEFVYEATFPAGQAKLSQAFYRPVAEALAQTPMRVDDLLSLPDVGGNRENPAELVGMLVGTGQASIVARPNAASESTAQRLNQVIAMAFLRAGRSQGNAALASLRLGAGLACLPVELLAATMQYDGSADDPFAWATMLGMTPESARQFEDVSRTLIERRSPVWRAAGVI